MRNPQGVEVSSRFSSSTTTSTISKLPSDTQQAYSPTQPQQKLKNRPRLESAEIPCKSAKQIRTDLLSYEAPQGNFATISAAQMLKTDLDNQHELMVHKENSIQHPVVPRILLLQNSQDSLTPQGTSDRLRLEDPASLNTVEEPNLVSPAAASNPYAINSRSQQLKTLREGGYISSDLILQLSPCRSPLNHIEWTGGDGMDTLAESSIHFLTRHQAVTENDLSNVFYDREGSDNHLILLPSFDSPTKRKSSPLVKNRFIQEGNGRLILEGFTPTDNNPAGGTWGSPIVVPRQLERINDAIIITNNKVTIELASNTSSKNGAKFNSIATPQHAKIFKANDEYPLDEVSDDEDDDEEEGQSTTYNDDGQEKFINLYKKKQQQQGKQPSRHESNVHHSADRSTAKTTADPRQVKSLTATTIRPQKLHTLSKKSSFAFSSEAAATTIIPFNKQYIGESSASINDLLTAFEVQANLTVTPRSINSSLINHHLQLQQQPHLQRGNSNLALVSALSPRSQLAQQQAYDSQQRDGPPSPETSFSLQSPLSPTASIKSLTIPSKAQVNRNPYGPALLPQQQHMLPQPISHHTQRKSSSKTVPPQLSSRKQITEASKEATSPRDIYELSPLRVRDNKDVKMNHNPLHQQQSRTTPLPQRKKSSDLRRQSTAKKVETSKISTHIPFINLKDDPQAAATVLDMSSHSIIDSNQRVQTANSEAINPNSPISALQPKHLSSEGYNQHFLKQTFEQPKQQQQLSSRDKKAITDQTSHCSQQSRVVFLKQKLPSSYFMRSTTTSIIAASVSSSASNIPHSFRRSSSKPNSTAVAAKSARTSESIVHLEANSSHKSFPKELAPFSKVTRESTLEQGSSPRSSQAILFGDHLSYQPAKQISGVELKPVSRGVSYSIGSHRNPAIGGVYIPVGSTLDKKSSSLLQTSYRNSAVSEHVPSTVKAAVTATVAGAEYSSVTYSESHRNIAKSDHRKALAAAAVDQRTHENQAADRNSIGVIERISCSGLSEVFKEEKSNRLAKCSQKQLNLPLTKSRQGSEHQSKAIEGKVSNALDSQQQQQKREQQPPPSSVQKKFFSEGKKQGQTRKKEMMVINLCEPSSRVHDNHEKKLIAVDSDPHHFHHQPLLSYKQASTTSLAAAEGAVVIASRCSSSHQANPTVNIRLTNQIHSTTASPQKLSITSAKSQQSSYITLSKLSKDKKQQQQQQQQVSSSFQAIISEPLSHQETITKERQVEKQSKELIQLKGTYFKKI